MKTSIFAMNGVNVFRPRLITALGLGALAWGLASCAVGPNYKRPDVATPTGFKRATPAEAAVPAIPNQWWALFNDSELTALAEKTVAANFDIKAAVARVDEARASLRVSRGDFYPTVDLQPSYRRSHSPTTTFSSNGTNTTGVAGGGTDTGTTTVVNSSGRTTSNYSLPLTLNYELDLWGSVRREVESAHYTELASETELEFVRQTAVSDMAQAYFNLRLYDSQIEIYQHSLDLFQKELDLTKTKFKAGIALQTDVLQAQTQVYSATAQLIEVERSRAKQEHAMAILLGEPPSAFSYPSHGLVTVVPIVPAGLPASLLNQRPDVAEAEQKLAAANAQIGVAEAAFYPSFSLTGSVGYQSSRHQDLITWVNRLWSIGPSINLPIFEGGKLAGTLQQRKATYRELLANYQTSVISAYKDVEDQLSDLHLLDEKGKVLDETVTSARENSRLTEIQYRQGITAYLQVIDANQTLLTNELAASAALNQRLIASVLLIKAVGGGWTPPGSEKSSR